MTVFHSLLSFYLSLKNDLLVQKDHLFFFILQRAEKPTSLCIGKMFFLESLQKVLIL